MVKRRHLLRPLRVVKERFVRLRHARGHGVHSPFVYSIVREVFMCRPKRVRRGDMYSALRECGVARKSACELQRLAMYLGADGFGINCVDGKLSIITARCEDATLEQILTDAKSVGATVVVALDYNQRREWSRLKELIQEHGSAIVDRRAYLLIFNNHLPKHYYKL